MRPLCNDLICLNKFPLSFVLLCNYSENNPISPTFYIFLILNSFARLHPKPISNKNYLNGTLAIEQIRFELKLITILSKECKRVFSDWEVCPWALICVLGVWISSHFHSASITSDSAFIYYAYGCSAFHSDKLIPSFRDLFGKRIVWWLIYFLSYGYFDI